MAIEAAPDSGRDELGAGDGKFATKNPPFIALMYRQMFNSFSTSFPGRYMYPVVTRVTNDDLVFLNWGYEEDPPMAIPLSPRPTSPIGPAFSSITTRRPGSALYDVPQSGALTYRTTTSSRTENRRLA